MSGGPEGGGPGNDPAAELAALFEGAPRYLARLAAAAPPMGHDPEGFFAVARAIAHAMPEDEQIELIDAHPRLGAPPERVSASSFIEQGYDRPVDVAAGGPTATGTANSVDVATELARLNDAYETAFGFRYCVFVAGRSRAALLPDFEAALTAPPLAERHRALDAVVDIAIDRHGRLPARAKEVTG